MPEKGHRAVTEASGMFYFEELELNITCHITNMSELSREKMFSISEPLGWINYLLSMRWCWKRHLRMPLNGASVSLPESKTERLTSSKWEPEEHKLRSRQSSSTALRGPGESADAAAFSLLSPRGSTHVFMEELPLNCWIPPSLLSLSLLSHSSCWLTTHRMLLSQHFRLKRLLKINKLMICMTLIICQKWDKQTHK